MKNHLETNSTPSQNGDISASEVLVNWDTTATSFSVIETKIARGERLTEADALFLFESPDLFRIGRLADSVNRRRNTNRVFYNINRHINPTNICALSCKFCAFSRKPGEAGGYAYDIPEMVTRAREAVAAGATEIHMVGGLHPRWSFRHYLDMIAAMHAEFPDVHLKAFTAVELDWMARRDRRTVAEVLADLRAAGLGSLPGGGAEIFHPEIRDQICDTKVSADQWIGTHRLAHTTGMRSNCTMLYGHIESFAHRVDHMRRLRDLQDETNGFNVFIPLSFQPFQNELGISRYTMGFDDLKTISVARLYLDNFANIKAYWVMLGQDIAQLALDFGANDLDGTVTEEKISRMAGGRAGMVMTRDDLEGLIQRAGKIPVERDTLYREIKRSAASSTSAASSASRSLLEDMNTNLGDASGPIGFVPAIRLTDTEMTTSGTELTAAALAGARDRYGFAPQTISVSLTPAGDLESVCREIARVCDENPDLTAAIEDHGAIAHWLANETRSVPEVARALATACVRHATLSVTRCEDESTLSAFALELAKHSIGRTWMVELSQSADATNTLPDWARYRRDLQVAKKLVTEAREKGRKSVCISTDAAATITPREFLRAIVDARTEISATGAVLSTSFRSIPTLTATLGIGSDATCPPQLKLVGPAIHAGIADFGALASKDCDWLRLAEDVRGSGRILAARRLQDGEQTDRAGDDAVSHGASLRPIDFGVLRHRPTISEAPV